MTDKSTKPAKKLPQNAKEARLSAALRANLRRRKVAKKAKPNIQTGSDSLKGE